MGHGIVTLAAAMLLAGAPALAEGAASQATREANRAFGAGLPRDDASEAALAARGFVATRADPLIRDAEGRVVMDLSAFDFAEGPAPATANPSLWRHLRLLKKHGLFEVMPGIWQVRGFDLSVMTVIRGDSGYVLIDPLTTAEVAAAAMALVREHLGDRPVRAVIYTHSHADHFGGVKGVVDEADVQAGRVAILAPDGFLEHAVSENLIAGPAMSRRGSFQFGTSIAPGPEGQAGAGIGAQLPRGSVGLIAPTRTIVKTGEVHVLDGVRMEFQLTPGTEAPAEMNIWLPEFRALSLAENANPTMHNVLPPRGALVRDAKAWADYLSESIRMYGGRADVLFTSHGWPRWGNAAVADYMASHRDAYKYLHDQTVRLMNRGLTAPEIAEMIALPPELAERWYNRGYYGTMKHNARAVYQRYLGWYDGNPANLDPWPPEEAARRWVAALGGAAKARAVVARALSAGDYRWAAEVARHIVFADPADARARAMLADAFTQMGYQAEGMLWRNMYLVGAAEARVTPTEPPATTVSRDMLAAVTTPQLFDLLAIRVDPDKAAGRDLALGFDFPDRGEAVRVTLRNRVLVHEADDGRPVAARVAMPRAAFMAMLFQGRAAADLLAAGVMRVTGDPAALQGLMQSLDRPDPSAPPFPIVTP